MGVILECLNLYGESLRREGKVDYVLREIFPSFSFCPQSLFHKKFLFSGKFGGKNLKTLAKATGILQGQKKKTRQGED